MTLPAKILFLLLLCGGLFLSGYFIGKADQRTAQQAAIGTAVKDGIVTHNEQAIAGNAVEAKALKAIGRQTTYTTQLIQEQRRAPNPPADCSLDPSRLYRWHAANRGAPVTASGQPDTDPAAGDSSAGQQPSGGSGGEPHAGSGDVPPGPGAVEGFGGMAGENQ
jgi:hypothetical protein